MVEGITVRVRAEMPRDGGRFFVLGRLEAQVAAGMGISGPEEREVAVKQRESSSAIRRTRQRRRGTGPRARGPPIPALKSLA